MYTYFSQEPLPPKTRAIGELPSTSLAVNNEMCEAQICDKLHQGRSQNGEPHADSRSCRQSSDMIVAQSADWPRGPFSLDGGPQRRPGEEAGAAVTGRSSPCATTPGSSPTAQPHDRGPSPASGGTASMRGDREPVLGPVAAGAPLAESTGAAQRCVSAGSGGSCGDGASPACSAEAAEDTVDDREAEPPDKIGRTVRVAHRARASLRWYR